LTWIQVGTGEKHWIQGLLDSTMGVIGMAAQQQNNGGWPLALKDATLGEIMNAFKHAYDLTQRDGDYVMSQLFDVTGVSVNQSSHQAQHVKTFKNGVKFVLKLNTQQSGTAKGYDGRIIDIVQPYYQYAKSYDAGKGWDKDPTNMPTSASLGRSTMSGYPYAITIYGTYMDNDRMASLYFNDLKAFQAFMTFVRGK
jgi:hypothetical protein